MWNLRLGNGKGITTLGASAPTEETTSGGLWFTFDDDSTNYKHWVSWESIEKFGMDEETHWNW